MATISLESDLPERRNPGTGSVRPFSGLHVGRIDPVAMYTGVALDVCGTVSIYS